MDSNLVEIITKNVMILVLNAKIKKTFAQSAK